MQDQLCKTMMLRVADDYERIANEIEARESRGHQERHKRG
jgi:hypothetical protein